ncbi:unnamed protein product [Ceratitis capitata]|uniref:(Mediterranean fruit fly) hypothetical protein n=1 Tax=Ceratitis capitata TaxID=7213 RepID=A0A811V0F2_CERCA|nr:unnamed protein product [Ceratitis capitata]
MFVRVRVWMDVETLARFRFISSKHWQLTDLPLFNTTVNTLHTPFPFNQPASEPQPPANATNPAVPVAACVPIVHASPTIGMKTRHTAKYGTIVVTRIYRYML